MSIFSAEKNVREDIRSAVPEFFSKLDKLIKEILGVKTNVSRLKTVQQSRDTGNDQNRSDRDVEDNSNKRTTNEQSDIRTDFPSTDTNPSLAGNQTSISSNRANQSPRQLDNQPNEPINIRIKTDERFGHITAEELLNQVRTEAIDMFYQLTPQEQEAHKAYLKQIQQAKTTQEIRPPRKEIYLMLKAKPMNQTLNQRIKMVMKPI